MISRAPTSRCTASRQALEQCWNQHRSGNVNTSRSSAKRKPRKHRGNRNGPPTVPAAPKDQVNERHGRGWAHYHDRIAQLECSITHLRGEAQEQAAWLARARESHAHFAELFEKAPAGYVVHDAAGVIHQLNRMAASLLGLGPSQETDLSLTQFLQGPDLAAWFRHMRQVKLYPLRRVSTEVNLHTRDGRILYVTLMTQPGATSFPHNPASFHTILSDISQLRATEQALARSQRDYHQLIDLIEGIVWEIDVASMSFTFVSRYAERLLGYPLKEWNRPSFWRNRIYVEDRERVLDQLHRALQRKTELRLDYRVLTSDRRILWLHDCINVVERDGGLRLVGVAIDVTDRRKADEELHRAHDLLEQRVSERTGELRRAVAELESFSYSLSHDMRAPIRAMRGYAELLERRIGQKLGPEAPEFLHRIMNSAERLDLLIQDVLQYSRVARAPLTLKPISMDRAVENILHDFPSLADCKDHIEVQQPLLSVYGHPAFIGQALSNLLTNAVKFMPPGRTPQVRLWTEDIRHERDARDDNSPAPGEWVRIWVQDNGVGIAPEDQSRLFRIFERVFPNDKYEGTGIGLAIVQKAVERMGGRVGVESAPGQGSKFWIELKRASAPAQS